MKDERFSDWLKRYLFAGLRIDWWAWGIFIMSMILFSLPKNDYWGGFIDAFMFIFAVLFGVLINHECKLFANKSGWVRLLVRTKNNKFTTLTFQIKHRRYFL